MLIAVVHDSILRSINLFWIFLRHQSACVRCRALRWGGDIYSLHVHLLEGVGGKSYVTES